MTHKIASPEDIALMRALRYPPSAFGGQLKKLMPSFELNDDDVREFLAHTGGAWNRKAGRICQRAHLFVIERPDLFEGAALAYGKQLRDFGLAQLPFDECVFQYLMADEDGVFYRGVFVCWQTDEYIFARLFIFGGLGEPKFPARTLRIPRAADAALNPEVCIVFDPGSERLFADDWFRDLSNTLFGLIGMLEADGIIHEHVPEPKFTNKQRVKKGKAPLNGYTLVRIDPARLSLPGHQSAGNSKASPRLHWRRGHIRKLRSGEITKVRPCLVGDKSKGFVRHDYVVSAGAEA